MWTVLLAAGALAAPPSHSLTTDPLLPLFRAASVVYGYRRGRHQLTLGAWTSRATETATRRLAYPGEVRSSAAIVGYRGYLWRGLHAAGWVMPGRSRYLSTSGDIDVAGLSVYAEARIGWRLQPRRLPVVLDLQWPVGASLVAARRPASFAAVDRRDPVFVIPFPNLWVGVVWPPRIRAP